MNKKCERNDRNFILNHGKNVSFSKYWLHGSQVSLLQLNCSKKSLLNKDSNLIFRSCFVVEYLSQSPSLTFYKSEWSPHCSQRNLCYYYFFLSSFLKSLQPISMKLQILHQNIYCKKLVHQFCGNHLCYQNILDFMFLLVSHFSQRPLKIELSNFK